ncbi:MAG: hypothetical protein AB1503_07830 [Bacillota bacterium]
MEQRSWSPSGTKLAVLVQAITFTDLDYVVRSRVLVRCLCYVFLPLFWPSSCLPVTQVLFEGIAQG